MSPDAPASSRPNGGRSAHRAEGVLRGSSMKGAVERRASTIAQEAARRARNTSDRAASCELRRKRGRRALRPIEARWSSQYAPWRRRGFAAAGGYSTVLPPRAGARCKHFGHLECSAALAGENTANTYFRATARRATPAAIISSVRTRFYSSNVIFTGFSMLIFCFLSCSAHSVG